MAEEGFTTRYALLLFVLSGALGLFLLCAGTGRLEGYDFRGAIHLGAFFALMAGTMLMWRAEHQHRHQ